MGGEVAEVLQRGDFAELLPKNASIMAFKRQLGTTAVYTLVNFSGEMRAYDLPELTETKAISESITGSQVGRLRPWEAVVYVGKAGAKS